MDKLKLQSLLYDITIPITLQKDIDTKIKALKNGTRDFNGVLDVVTYLTASKIVVIKDKFSSLVGFSSGTTTVETMLLDKFADTAGFIYTLGVMKVGIKTINDPNLLVGVEHIYGLFGNNIKATLTSVTNIKAYNGLDYLYMDDEADLLNYLLDTLKSVAGFTDLTEEVVLEKGTTLKLKLDSLEKIFTTLNWAVDRTKKIDDDKIIFVAEKDNFRYSIYFAQKGYYGQKVALHYKDSPLYNYIDVDRSFVYHYNFTYKFPLNDIGQILSAGDRSLIANELEHLPTQPVTPMTKEYIAHLIHEKKKTELFQQSKASVSKALRSKIDYKISTLSTRKTPFKLNDVEYQTDGITYSGQDVKITKIIYKKGASKRAPLETVGVTTLKGMVEIIDSYHNSLRTNYEFISQRDVASVTDLTFDLGYDYLIKTVCDYLVGMYQSTVEKMYLTIGDVKVVYHTESTVNINGVTTSYHFLNGSKITKTDVAYCIYQAISFDDQKLYDDFISGVSYTSLKVHKIVKAGLSYNIYDDLFREYIRLNISVTREKNKNFLMINGKPKRIRNINKILRTVDMSLFDMVETLLNKDFVEDLKYNDLKGFIEISKKEFEDKRAKTKGLVDNTLKVLDVKTTGRKTFHNGIVLNSAYHIKGGLREYYVDTNEPYKIYSGSEGRYICMLDKSPFVAPEVKLVNRLYALKNDSVISTQIATLNF